MAVVDGFVQELRRSRQVGQRAVFISKDGSGTELRLPTELDRQEGSPDAIFVLITAQDLTAVETEGEGDDGDVVEEALAAEAAGEAQGVADALEAVAEEAGAAEEE